MLIIILKMKIELVILKIEILNAYSPLYFDHKQKLSCITSAMNLIKILTADSQSNIKFII